MALMERQILGPHQKAFMINLDPSSYGAFAEIGAGQEVAHWFFRVGGAAGTIAKTMSAYDMTVSDAIYGSCERYVSRQRLNSMLDQEFTKLQGRLNEKRGANTKFFVFADTVAARSHTRRDNCHGWLGVRFQTAPLAPPSQVVIHVTLLDNDNLQQQEALGIVGVNLVHGTLYLHNKVEDLIISLLDNLTRARVEVDMIEFSGPEFEGMDNRLMVLQLVQHGLTNAAMFNADGKAVMPADFLYKKCILVERGSFRPVTHVTLDMMRSALAQFIQQPQAKGEEVTTLMEMTLHKLTDGDHIDHKDFLDRADTICALGKNVLISNYFEFHRLASFLFRHTKKMIGISMGVPTLKEIFEEKYYQDLEGGILESFGRLFKNDLRLFVYPYQDPATGSIITAGNLRVEPHLRHLHSYLMENHFIQALHPANETHLPILSRQVLAQIKAGDPTWEQSVPEKVAQMIRERQLFGWQEPQKAVEAEPVLAASAQ
jgi:hypothetical protein